MSSLKERLGFTPTLFIDDGHGMETPGKRTPMFPDGHIVHENEFNRPTAEKLAALAIAQGFNIMYVAPEINDTPLRVRTDRANDAFITLREQYPNVNRYKLGIYVSIHFNALTGKWDDHQGGVGVYHYPGSTIGERLAYCVGQRLIQGTPQRFLGVIAENFHVLRESIMPAVLIEAGFMDISKEAVLMTSQAFQLEVARETLAGIMDYLGVS
jgi:N-acetylmuramoyl-L-alanine amidase